MIKKIIILAVAAFFVSTAANAEEIKDTLGIMGKWIVYAEGPSKDKQDKAVDTSWEFKPNGELHAVSKDPRTKTMDLTAHYLIEGNAIMKEKAGRPGKFERCSVEKHENEMILGCPGLYFFMKKAN